MPNLEYDDLATKADVERARIELRGEMVELRADVRAEMAELRGEMAQMHGALERRMATNVRATVATHIGSIAAVAGLFAGFS